MSDLSCAVNLIRKYEGFSEKAYPLLATELNFIQTVLPLKKVSIAVKKKH